MTSIQPLLLESTLNLGAHLQKILSPHNLTVNPHLRVMNLNIQPLRRNARSPALVPLERHILPEFGLRVNLGRQLTTNPTQLRLR